MDVLTLGSKSALAVMLLIAGGAKFADLASFAATVRLFVPYRAPWLVIRRSAMGVALVELAVGAASLSWPPASWLNLFVFVLGCAFVVVSVVGYVFHRGRSCLCFGALSQRKFDALGILRAAVILAVAAIAMFGVRPATPQVGVEASAMLAVAAVLIAITAFTAAKALSAARVAHPGLATR